MHNPKTFLTSKNSGKYFIPLYETHIISSLKERGSTVQESQGLVIAKILVGNDQIAFDNILFGMFR